MWARDLIHDHRNPLHWQKVVWPLLVIMLFYNNGTLLANSTLAAKSLTYAVANSILNDTSSGIEAKRQIQMTLFKDSFSSYAAAQKQACVGITNQDEHDQCISNAEAKAAELAKKAQGLTPGLPNGSFPLDLLGALKGVFATGIVEILQASAAAFHYLAALVLAIWAATGPFWVSLTLLPISTKGINFFISGFFGISVLIITEDMLNAATAISLAQAPDTDPLFVPLLMGLLNPFLAVIIGSGGAIGIFVGISKGINWLTGKFI